MSLISRYRALPRHERVLWILGPIAGLVMVAMATWWSLAASVGKPMWGDLAYDVRDDRHVVVTYQLTRPPEKTTVCTIVAKQTDHGSVGRMDDVIEPGGDSRLVRTVEVRTTSLAVIGMVDQCRSYDPSDPAVAPS
ncbi:MAG: DUF4307 domain-containing protein [Mobilicoccus sp.]|nr:DUF4307 domain-containing protein [Mobilicoccus sp.]